MSDYIFGILEGMASCLPGLIAIRLVFDYLRIFLFGRGD